VAAYADIRDAAGQILLVQTIEAIGGRWFLPGGGVEFGEHPDDAVRREVREETGLTVLTAQLRQVVSDVIELPDETLHSIRFIYSAVVDDPADILRNEIGGSTVKAAWFRPDQLAELPLTEFVMTYLTSLGTT
jgi:8-oxo-dGTP diphosphatase